jgi:hypothetical protein
MMWLWTFLAMLIFILAVIGVMQFVGGGNVLWLVLVVPQAMVMAGD